MTFDESPVYRPRNNPVEYRPPSWWQLNRETVTTLAAVVGAVAAIVAAVAALAGGICL